MPSRMWSLADFRFDGGIEPAEVYLDRGAGLEAMPRDEAIAYAHRQGAPNLVAQWPAAPDEVPSEETRYFVAGFLAGNEPRYPDDDGTGEADMTAWAAATARFRRTGLWYGRWGTCAECGCVLLPDSAEHRCQVHRTPAGTGA